MKYLLSVLLLATVLSAHANVLSGDAFLQMCGPLETAEKAVFADKCTGYVSGVYEAYLSFNEWELIADTLCPSEEVTSAQMTSTVLDYITKQQDYAQKPASGLILNALADHYPCK